MSEMPTVTFQILGPNEGVAKGSQKLDRGVEPQRGSLKNGGSSCSRL